MLTSKNKLLIGFCAATLFTAVNAGDQPGLSEEFLNFLIDFEETDENTFEMLVENGKEDVLNNQQKIKDNETGSNLQDGLQDEVKL